MKNGICVKCSGKEIYCKDVSPKSSDRVTLKDGVISKDASTVIRYICVSCGYLEYYLSEQTDLDYICEHWDRV